MNVRDPNTIKIMAAMNAANATSCTAVAGRSLMVTVKRNRRMLSNATLAIAQLAIPDGKKVLGRVN